MTIRQVRRVAHLHERAMRHANEYQRLSDDPSAESKAFKHLQKAAQLYSQVFEFIEDRASVRD